MHYQYQRKPVNLFPDAYWLAAPAYVKLSWGVLELTGYRGRAFRLTGYARILLH